MFLLLVNSERLFIRFFVAGAVLLYHLCLAISFWWMYWVIGLGVMWILYSFDLIWEVIEGCIRSWIAVMMCTTYWFIPEIVINGVKCIFKKFPVDNAVYYSCFVIVHYGQFQDGGTSVGSNKLLLIILSW